MGPSVDIWHRLVEEAETHCDPTVEVDTGHGQAGSGASQPQMMSGSAGKYAVKLVNNPQGSRVLFNEQVVGRLAARLGMPCPVVSVVDVTVEGASGVHFVGDGDGQPGPAHGSAWLEGVNQVGLDVALAVPGNRSRYTQLMVLFTVVRNVDPQYVYEVGPPHHLYSVDHGHALLGNVWSSGQLDAAVPPAEIGLHNAEPLDRSATAAVLRELEMLTDADIARLVSCIPDSWGVPIEDRLAAARFLRRQVDAVIVVLQKDEAHAA